MNTSRSHSTNHRENNTKHKGGGTRRGGEEIDSRPPAAILLPLAAVASPFSRPRPAPPLPPDLADGRVRPPLPPPPASRQPRERREGERGKGWRERGREWMDEETQVDAWMRRDRGSRTLSITSCWRGPPAWLNS